MRVCVCACVCMCVSLLHLGRRKIVNQCRVVNVVVGIVVGGASLFSLLESRFL